MKTYHIGKDGSDHNDGSINNKFLTIQAAADIAVAGDTVIVHEGVYRENVDPKNGGSSNINRITYRAADNEKVIIKGSEIIKGWIEVENGVYKKIIPNSFFGSFNPYKEIIFGDWLVYPTPQHLHRGEVYLNGRSLFEVFDEENLFHPVKKKTFKVPLVGIVENVKRVDDTLHTWMCNVDDDNTTIYVNFGNIDPNEETIEINVRENCFYPSLTHLNYITVSGFEMAMAATPWAPPTADQPGLIGPHWSKGWIIENNIIHDSKCSAISLGKEISTGDNECSKYQIKPGYQCQMEAVFKALEIGWSKDTIGSHIVRNNTIYECGQNGIVGHMGCVFSEIYNNHIYNIGTKHEYFGWEIAGIKFHAPIDVIIRNNCIHDTSLGLWLDWQTQGTRVSSNVLYNNGRDCTIEVSSGPFILDNNIFGSTYNFDYLSQGGAFINNLFCGCMSHKKVLDRSTPYHAPHSTTVRGCTLVYSGDDRFINNIFVGSGGRPLDKIDAFSGTEGFDMHPSSNDEFHRNIITGGTGDIEKFVLYEQPVQIEGNVYLNCAKKYKEEKNFYKNESFNPEIKFIEKEDGIYMQWNIPEDMKEIETYIPTTESLETVRIVDATFDNPDGSSITFDCDMLGNKRSTLPTPGPLEMIERKTALIKVF
jgi:hypothetical protein